MKTKLLRAVYQQQNIPLTVGINIGSGCLGSTWSREDTSNGVSSTFATCMSVYYYNRVHHCELTVTASNRARISWK